MTKSPPKWLCLCVVGEIIPFIMAVILHIKQSDSTSCMSLRMLYKCQLINIEFKSKIDIYQPKEYIFAELNHF